MNYVSLGIEHFINPVNGKPVSNGSIFIGEPDTDPEIVGNQKTVYYRQEDGTEIAAAQPIRTGAGGVPLYNGSPVQILVNGDYSIKVLTQLGAQAYYIPSNTGSEPIVVQTISDLRSLEPISGYAVNLLGYYSSGDGGGGPIRVAKTGAVAGTYVDNGGSIIVPTGGDGSAAWVWEWGGAVNARWAGVRFDGLTDDTTRWDAVAALGVEVVGYGTTIVNNFTPPAGFSCRGVGGTIVFKLGGDNDLVTMSSDDLSFENVDFDAALLNTSTPFPVKIPASTKRTKLRNVEFRNFRGGITGSEIQNNYGLFVDLDGVQDFEFENLRFKEISNLGDAVATFNGFTGGIFFFNINDSIITPATAARGTITNADFDTIYTRYPAGSTATQKQADNDADAIRFFGSPTPIKADIKIKNISCRSVGKRLVKISGVSGIQIDGAYCDGSAPPDTDVPMPGIIKINGENIVNNVIGYFGSYPATDAIQLFNADYSIITNILIDDASYIVGETGTSGYITIENIRATVHGGLRLENLAEAPGIVIDNAYLRYDRNGRFSTNSNKRGASFINTEGLKIGKLFLKNGQFFAPSASNFSYDDIHVEWTDTTDPATTAMAGQQIVDISGEGVRMGKFFLNVSDLLPNYLDRNVTAVLRIGGGNGYTGGETKVASKNNNAVHLYRSSDSKFGNFVLDSDYDLLIGDVDSPAVVGCEIDSVSFLTIESKIRFLRTTTDTIIGRILKKASNGGDLTAFVTPTLSNIFFERVYWEPGAGVVTPTAAITVVHEFSI